MAGAQHGGPVLSWLGLSIDRSCHGWAQQGGPVIDSIHSLDLGLKKKVVPGRRKNGGPFLRLPEHHQELRKIPRA
eukprot:gene18161-biopygen5267